jgi:hypothetical protein
MWRKRDLTSPCCTKLSHFMKSRPALPFFSVTEVNLLSGSTRGLSGQRVSGTGLYRGHDGRDAAEEVELCISRRTVTPLSRRRRRRKGGRGRRNVGDDEMVSNGGHGIARAPSPQSMSCTSGVGSTLSWISRRSHAELDKSSNPRWAG